MKHFFHTSALFFLLLFADAIHAQVPQGINYQAVVRGSNGEIITNENVTFTFSVISSLNNDELYSEAHFAATNEFGLVNLVVGTGTPTISTFDQLDWEIPYQLHTYVTIEATTIDMGVSDLQSVPYALNAGSAMALSPSATVSTQQIAGGNAQINQVLQFNGTNWVAANLPSGNGGDFDLPYAETDTYNQALLQVTNTNQGAIEGFSTNGIGLYGSSTNNSAVSGVSFGNSPTVNGSNFGNVDGSVGVKGYSQSGIGVAGQTDAANWFGLFGYNNSGTGIKGLSTGNNTVAIVGEATGAGSIGVRGLGLEVGVIGQSTNGDGIYGASSSGSGVFGVSDQQGVWGESWNGIGIRGHSTWGTGVLAESDNELALDVDGRINIDGPGQSPKQGKVLTSDNDGNATWEGAIAFRMKGIIDGANQDMPENTDIQVLFEVEEYDLSNNYNNVNNTFTVPVTGIYHFDTRVATDLLTSDESMRLKMMRSRSGNVAMIAWDQESVNSNGLYAMEISTDMMLQAGDVIYFYFSSTHTSITGDEVSLQDTNFYQHIESWLNGRLVTKL